MPLLYSFVEDLGELYLRAGVPDVQGWLLGLAGDCICNVSSGGKNCDHSIGCYRGAFDGNHGLHEWDGSCGSSQSNRLYCLRFAKQSR